MLVLVLQEEECPSCEEVVEELRGLQNEFPASTSGSGCWRRSRRW